ncbi:MAG TPA: hypothetical protein VID68_01625 [Solirubrobacteraceae bacterium]|jgi:hypothetical protein
MSGVAEREVTALYLRYKGLALAVGATLVLERDAGELAGEAARLAVDARSLREHAGKPYCAPIEACAGAADDLRALAIRPGDGKLTERVRASHGRLRREVWKLIPCEYVPCGGTAAHVHEREELGDG